MTDETGPFPFFQVVMRQSHIPPGSQIPSLQDNWNPTFNISPPFVTLPAEPGGSSAKASKYKYDRLFDDKCNTHVVYDQSVKPLVHLFLAGKNATVFTFGHDNGLHGIEVKASSFALFQPWQ
jgi:hypothetical protein